jgi:hypothetical protein
MEYVKIPGPFERNTEKGPDRNKLIVGRWSCREFEVLQNAPWFFTEKVDGTNIRIMWTGYERTFGGRTDNAQLPTRLIPVLERLFPEEILEQVFGKSPAILYGEGYGAGIQSGGVYRADQSFVMFDVYVPRTDAPAGWWLERASIEDVAAKMGLDVVPRIYTGTLNEAIGIVQQGFRSKWNADHVAEGLVGVSAPGLLNRKGERIIVKLKTKDLLGTQPIMGVPQP